MAAPETDRATVLQQLESYRRDLASALSAAEHACEHLRSGDLAAACNVLAETTYELERGRQDYLAIVKALEALRKHTGDGAASRHVEAAQQASVPPY